MSETLSSPSANPELAHTVGQDIYPFWIVFRTQNCIGPLHVDLEVSIILLHILILRIKPAKTLVDAMLFLLRLRLRHLIHFKNLTVNI